MPRKELNLSELVSNPATRTPVVLCVDTSASMGWEGAIDDLNRGVDLFFDALQDDEKASISVEVAIVAFDSEAKMILDFNTIDNQSAPILTADGLTTMGEGVNLALDLLENRKIDYKSGGISYYQPWLVLMTDGEPTDDISSAVDRTLSLQKSKGLTTFCIGVGDDVNIETLKRFSIKNMVLKVESSEYFRELFEWLSASASAVSNSNLGEKINLPDVPRVIQIDV